MAEQRVTRYFHAQTSGRRQPFRQKGVDLGLFIRMVHEFIWISVDRFDPLIATTADHLGNSGIVITAHGELGIVQPAPPLWTCSSRRCRYTCSVRSSSLVTVPKYISPLQSKLTAISQQAGTRQLTYPEVIRLSSAPSLRRSGTYFFRLRSAAGLLKHTFQLVFLFGLFSVSHHRAFYHRMVQRQPLKCHDGGSIVNLS